MSKVEALGDSIVVHFNNAKGLKTTNGKAPTGFWITDTSGKWMPADAKIAGQSIVLKSSKIKTPIHVRYAFVGKPEVNLINDANLPAYPFRSDNIAP